MIILKNITNRLCFSVNNVFHVYMLTYPSDGKPIHPFPMHKSMD
ncbi:hypothetical protein B4064_3109 [Caldibacillus thermoamylovorans]|uniref:Uncharacterized protein n=1 Tax=Caldibacillus thermoamylovorans TaxID=35841 RepID=A0ABD4A3E3_9BACI|nr:hypothetical protein B4166_3485 [Caldibacillus thermoamylovorans]KIO63891.1 hypothetical protein B4064_3109 [Caldibacillus thermoamylovorans]KIO71463.1 hypothetical protein B4167_3720 [Caldibacillus thermoamylovorans]